MFQNSNNNVGTPGTAVAAFLVFVALMLQGLVSQSQDTFSIVAVDPVTGEVGSAGASCVGSSLVYPHGAKILSDVIPGIGVIHTQASWLPSNQQNAHNWMMQGLSPQQIIDSLVARDGGGNPTIRQYGIVDFNGGNPRSAAYTGVNCLNYKNDTAHMNYSIQGNILMGQEILDSMQTRFLNTPGTLADKLMAALQGAKVVGADTRCAPRNASSQSAFLRVARMQNSPDSLYLDLWMAYPQALTGIYPVDPIDSLQTLYDAWKSVVAGTRPVQAPAPQLKIMFDESGAALFDFTLLRDYSGATLSVFNIAGKKLASLRVGSRIERIVLPAGGPELLICNVMDGSGRQIVRQRFFRPGR